MQVEHDGETELNNSSGGLRTLSGNSLNNFFSDLVSRLVALSDLSDAWESTKSLFIGSYVQVLHYSFWFHFALCCFSFIAVTGRAAACKKEACTITPNVFSMKSWRKEIKGIQAKSCSFGVYCWLLD